MNKKVTARAHTNIALIKYWGKKNPELIIPTTSSLSLTLDQFYTDTAVVFNSNLSHDELTLNGQPITDHTLLKTSTFLDIVRQMAGINTFARIESTNHVPTAAGLASSASGFAALAAASSKAAGLNLDRQALSRLARRGSGSASRSIFGGFAEWIAGEDDLTSYAHPIQENVTMDIQMLTVVLDGSVKKIGSRQGMQHAIATSPFYDTWVAESEVDLVTMKQAIANNDFQTLGELAEHNALQMHSLNFTAKPAFTYFNGDTLNILNLVQNLRHQGIQAYATMDAGPNVKIISQSTATQVICEAIKKDFPNATVEVAKPGPGISYL
ncbi:diphosphomevalonate decarboxylase [Periweissella fabaria]|uniref:diphosphomevalonate decarboxylase n=1 Tax=Periweissella fabaria TaxID=546157 RepID=A0ABM8Z6U4_9LACO|nr:diphosphomevalonate decarboxylase [Periweissella fabaria]MCM0597113.1 diphosphomevalonate decarboxylase [Periweissella fabaria]CAH0417102.1 hypothetical protein WFA24289_01419 [Periweissella fabaria]